MKRLLILITIMLGSALAVDTPNGSEQFYVVQGLFADLQISQVACPIQDDRVNFACGNYFNSFGSFQVNLDNHIKIKLSGLSLSSDWFNNAGAFVRGYVSAQGRYFFTYSPNGYIVVAFIPNQ